MQYTSLVSVLISATLFTAPINGAAINYEKREEMKDLEKRAEPVVAKPGALENFKGFFRGHGKQVGAGALMGAAGLYVGKKVYNGFQGSSTTTLVATATPAPAAAPVAAEVPVTTSAA